MTDHSSQSAGGNPPPLGSKMNPLHMIGTIHQAGGSPPPPKQETDPKQKTEPKQKTNPWFVVGVLLLLGLLLVGIVELFMHQQYIVAVLLTLFTFGGLVLFGYTSPPFAWTGFGPYKGPEDRDHQARSLWDWLTLLIIPIVLGAGAIGFSTLQSNSSDQLNMTQYNQQLNIAATRYTNDQQLAKDQQQESALQTYLDRMSDLLLNTNLHSNNQLGVNVRILATARTLTILPDLNGPRKATVLNFLHAAGLIGRQGNNPNFIDPVVNLNSADFSNINLTNFALSGANLANVNFSGAILNGADLSGAYLSDVNLSKAKLQGAHICSAQITALGNSRPDLSGADLTNAHLGGTDLLGADLIKAILNGTQFGSDDQVCATNSGADLTNADLTEAIVTNADFTNVTWKNTTCPDRTNSDTNGSNSCFGH